MNGVSYALKREAIFQSVNNALNERYVSYSFMIFRVTKNYLLMEKIRMLGACVCVGNSMSKYRV